MDTNSYTLERLAQIRLAERRAEAARDRLLASVSVGRRDLRALLGLALIRAGRRVARRAIPSLRPA